MIPFTDAEVHLYDSTDMIYPEEANLQRQGLHQWLPTAGVGTELTVKLHCSDGCTTWKCSKITEIYILFFNIFYCLCYYSCTIPPISPFRPGHPSGPHSPPFSSCPWVVCCIYKLFGFYISYIILNLPLSILYLPIMFLSLYLFPHCSPSSSQLITLQMISISMILFLFLFFAQFVLQIQLLIVVKFLPF